MRHLFIALLVAGIFLALVPVTSAQAAAPYQMKVLNISYFPVVGDQIDTAETGIIASLAFMRQKVAQLTQETMDALVDGSRYQGDQNPNAPASMQYSVVNSVEYLERIPRSTNMVPWNPGVYRPDYYTILTNLNICSLVEQQGVNEVWMWGYHYGDLEPVESDMAGPYGDISNSERNPTDLPICAKTYVLYNYNYNGGTGWTVHDHMHQLEAVYRAIDYDLFWNRFVLPYGDDVSTNHCGWAHFPPNAVADYDWANQTPVDTNCDDWHPDGSGTIATTNCTGWGCADLPFFLWWMQNLPGQDNTLIDNNRFLRNWWDAIGDFDGVMAAGPTLHASLVSTPTPPPPGSNKALNQQASSNRFDSVSGHTPAKAVDGDTTTFGNSWQVANPLNAGDWWQVDLGTVQAIDKVIVYPNAQNYHDFCSVYRIQTSISGSFLAGQATTVVTEPNRPETIKTTYVFPSQDARYVRIICDESRNWVQLQEVEVFGPDVIPTSGPTITPSPSATATPTPTPTRTPTPTPTRTPTPIPTLTPTPTRTPTPMPTTPPQTVTLSAVADAYVASGNPNTNYGRANTMKTDASPVQISYVRFDLSSLAGKQLISATLRIKTATDASNGAQNVKPVSNTSWSETTMTYNNRPALGSTVLGTFTPNKTKTWKEITVTSAVSPLMGNPVSFAIDTASNDSAGYYTREATDKPVLVLTYQ